MIRRAMCQCQIETAADDPTKVCLAGRVLSAPESEPHRSIRKMDAEAWEITEPAASQRWFVEGNVRSPPTTNLFGTTKDYECKEPDCLCLNFPDQCTGWSNGLVCTCPESFPYAYAGVHHPEHSWAKGDGPGCSPARQLWRVHGRRHPGRRSGPDEPGMQHDFLICTQPDWGYALYSSSLPVLTCRDNEQTPPDYVPSDHIPWVLHDFCFADFNYCVGVKLLNAARSVVTPPRTVGIQHRLLEHATMHLTESVGSYASGFQSEPPGFALGLACAEGAVPESSAVLSIPHQRLAWMSCRPIPRLH